MFLTRFWILEVKKSFFRAETGQVVQETLLRQYFLMSFI